MCALAQGIIRCHPRHGKRPPTKTLRIHVRKCVPRTQPRHIFGTRDAKRSLEASKLPLLHLSYTISRKTVYEIWESTTWYDKISQPFAS